MEDKRITKTKRALKSALLKLLTTQAFDATRNLKKFFVT